MAHASKVMAHFIAQHNLPFQPVINIVRTIYYVTSQMKEEIQ